MPGESSSIFLEKNSCGAVLVLLLAWIESFPWSELMSMQFSVFQLEIKGSSTIFKLVPSTYFHMWSMEVFRWAG